MAQDLDLEFVTALAHRWKALLVEEANRRGLETSLLTVAAAELAETPQLGVQGMAQARAWLTHALASAAQRR